MKSRIGYKLILSLVLFSSLITFIATALQLYFDYRVDINRIKSYEALIKDSYLKSITVNVWLYNEKQIQTQLNGILNLPDMEHIRIRSEEGADWSVGKVSSKRQQIKKFPLLYEHKGKMINIGSLTAVISLDNIYKHLVEKALAILLSNAIKTFLVSGFMLMIFQYLVTRHLYSLSKWLKSLDIGKSFEKFYLNRSSKKSKKFDELDEVVVAINKMQENLENYLNDLIESEKKYRSIFNNAVDGIFQSTVEGRFISVNSAFARILGYSSPDELINSISDITSQLYVNPEDRMRYIQLLQEFGQVENYEFKARRKDGAQIWVSNSAYAKRDPKGNLIYYEGTTKDITDRKQMEEALRDSEAKYQDLYENAPDMYVSVDAKTARIKECNQTLVNATGYSKEEIIGKLIFEMYSPKSVEYTRTKVFPQFVKTGTVKGEELQLQRKDGSTIDVLLNVTAVRDQKGNIISSRSSWRDISEKKAIELNLMESEKRFKDLALNSTDWIWEFDENEIFTYSSPSSKKLLGYSPEEIIGQSAFDPMSSQETKKVMDEFVTYKDAREPFSSLVNVNQHKNGSEIIMESSGVPIIDSEGIYRGYRGIDRDISERIRMEARLRQAQKMESIGTLAGGIAHDFNNLLYPIIGFAEMLKEDLPQESPEYESAHEIFKAGRRGGELVNQILAFSRQSEHKMTLIRVQNVLKEVLKLTRSTIPSNVEIRENIQQDCGLVMADPTQLHQIAMNLITNAFHAVEDKNGKIYVELKESSVQEKELPESELQPGQYVRLSVSDNGIGMNQDITNRIFEPYFTTKDQGKGTGLGLSLVYGIVKEHGGDIMVDSKIGIGTTFNIYLPLMAKASEPAAVDQVSGSLTGRESILLVDDEVSVAKLESQMLSRLGYQVTIKTSSEEALNTFRSNPDAFELVISDMTMPNMTGDQLANEILSIKPGMPIIICTGFSERMDKKNAKEIGVKGYLMKPVVKSDIAKMVRKVLDDSENV